MLHYFDKKKYTLTFVMMHQYSFFLFNAVLLCIAMLCYALAPLITPLSSFSPFTIFVLIFISFFKKKKIHLLSIATHLNK